MDPKSCKKPSRRAILLEMLEKNRVLDFNFAVQQRAETHLDSELFHRQLCLQQMERETENGLRKASEAVVLRRSEKIQEELLAKEMKKIQDAEDLEPRLKLQLRRNEPLLRKTESQLRACYTKKDQLAQMAEKQQRKIDEQKEKQKEKLNMEFQELKFKIDDEGKTKQMKQYEYRRELDKQMEEKGKKVIEQKYDDYIKQRDLVSYVMGRIHQEDRDILERKARRVKQEQCDMAESFWWKAELAERKRREEEIRLRNIEIARHKSDEELRLWHENRKKVFLEKQMRNERLAIEHVRQSRIKDDKTRLQNMLLEAECDELDVHAADIDWKDVLQRKLIAMRDMMINQESEALSKRMKKEAREDEKRIFWESLEASERLFKMREDATINRKKEMQAGFLRMLEEHRALQAQTKDKMKCEEIERLRIEREKEKVLQYERDVMLKEHVPQLVGHIAPGILRVDDLDKFHPDIKEMYKPKPKLIYP